MATNIAVVYQSGKGHTRFLAEAVRNGVQHVSKVRGQLFEISGQDLVEGRFTNLALMAELDSCDGIIFGCAAYMRSASAVFKAFLEAAFAPKITSRHSIDPNPTGNWSGHETPVDAGAKRRAPVSSYANAAEKAIAVGPSLLG